MESENFKENFNTTLSDIFKKFPDNTVSEILYSVLHRSNFKGGHYINATEEELYSSAEKFRKYGENILEDEPMTDSEWEQWREGKFIQA